MEREVVDPRVAWGETGRLTGGGGFGSGGADLAAEGVVVEVGSDLTGDGGGGRTGAAGGFDLVVVPDVAHVVHHGDVDLGVPAHRLVRVHGGRLREARLQPREASNPTGCLPRIPGIKPTPDVGAPDARPFPCEVGSIGRVKV